MDWGTETNPYLYTGPPLHNNTPLLITTYQQMPSIYITSKNNNIREIRNWACYVDHKHGYATGYGQTRKDAHENAIDQLRLLAAGLEVPMAGHNFDPTDLGTKGDIILLP